MEFATLVYQPTTGWTVPPDSRLDSPMAALARALPHSRFASAATPTIAHDRQSIDGALIVCIARFNHTTLRGLRTELTPYADR